jgi:hypothetical protein
MKKQIFTIILFTIVSMSVFGQSFKLDATGANDMRLRTNALDRLTILPTGNVGIGTITPDAKLDVNGDLILAPYTYSPGGNYTGDPFLRFLKSYMSLNPATGATITIKGIDGGTVDRYGLMLFISCGGAGTVILKNNASALAANKINTNTGSDITITGRGGATLVYDTDGWRVVSYDNGGGSGWGLTGNTGTNPATDFIGTSNAQDLVFKTNGIERMRVDADASVLTLKSSLSSYNRFGGYKSLGTDAAPTLVTNGTDLASFIGYGYSGSTYRPAAGIIFQSTRRFSNDEIGGRIIFSTTGPGVGPLGIPGLERMRIEENGRVGIGTTTPTAKLDVDGDIVVRTKMISATASITGLSRGGASSLYFNGSGIVYLDGILDGQDGMLLYIFTSGNTTLLLRDDNSFASSGNRIYTNTGATLTISGRGGATLIYDGDSAHWRVIGIAN